MTAWVLLLTGAADARHRLPCSAYGKTLLGIPFFSDCGSCDVSWSGADGPHHMTIWHADGACPAPPNLPASLQTCMPSATAFEAAVGLVSEIDLRHALLPLRCRRARNEGAVRRGAER
jgi:hypothetical protein